MQENLSAAYCFHGGKNFHAQEYFGHHTENGRTVFRTWAPGAERIALVGDFNDWNDGRDLFYRVTDGGVWEASVDAGRICNAQKYKFKIFRGGCAHYKADPYARYSETLEHTASMIWQSGYEWGDADFLDARSANLPREGIDSFSVPINIYEMHLGSWCTRDGRCTVNGDAYLNYRQIAERLIPYLKKMGYTHVELMPIMEHPFDGSWGYQICSFFAPTSRFGTPDDFKAMIDALHRAGIGVILDWVPGHFPKDEHGLYEFDGGPLYEFSDPKRMEHKAWGTRCFDLGRAEVQSFLISSALWWIEEYHADGLRIDAVASMLYLDYDRRAGEWTPNREGGNVSEEAVAFLRKLNSAVLSDHPEIMMIAEESTAFPGVTLPPYESGLGFNFKWNMGWANDMFDYLATDPFFRAGNHKRLTFPMVYAFSERFILPISHDEIVHGKKSLIDKIASSYEQRFPTLRTFFTYMMTTPGKKMLFMGCEYGQFREWDYQNQLEWFMTDYENHDLLQYFVAELNHFYLTHPALWECDFGWDGFEWVSVNDVCANVIAYKRFDRAKNQLLTVVNFSAADRKNYPLAVGEQDYEVVFSTEEARFGGSEQALQKLKNQAGVITLDLKPLSAGILRPTKRKEQRNVQKT